MKITITMSKPMYRLLLNGRKATADQPAIGGCKTHQGVIDYVNATFGLYGTVENIIIE